MRVHIGDLARMGLSWAISSLALVVAADLLPGLTAESPLWFVPAAAVAALFGMLFRPLFVEFAAVAGWAVVAVLGFFGQATIMYLAMLAVPGIEMTSFWVAVLATWLAAGISTLLTWALTSGTDEAFVASLRRRSRRRGVVEDPAVDGALFVQLDGVAYPVAQWALQSGSMPTLHRWVSEGSHHLWEWTVQLPCTTPASQLGILHGTCAGVPAFRWYDRDLGRVIVANHPADAALIEERAGHGAGLLSSDGVSVSNLFSGGASRTSLTMSQVSLTRGSRATRRAVSRFMVRPDGFLRSVTRTCAEMARERFQAADQRRRHVQPRVRRSWTFAVLRAITNGLLRDLNTAIVAEEMMRGTHSIYVDYVDYDEVAHHAGGNRLESLRVLQSLDGVLSVLERIAHLAPRRYRIIVLSDHGQSQGEPFAAQFGHTLGDLCAELTAGRVTTMAEDVESWGRAESLFADLAGDTTPSERAADAVASRMRSHTRTPDAAAADSELIALGSGNLGLIYAKSTKRLTLEQVQQRWPSLVRGLAAHPGVAFVAGVGRESGPLVIGADGSHRLLDGHVGGVDPLAAFGAHAPQVLRRALEMPQAPELYVNSIVDPSTREVAAFEDLLGCHGGLGGWQDRGMLMAPTDLVDDGAAVQGAEQLHVVLVTILERLGHRRARSERADDERSSARPLRTADAHLLGRQHG
jgi:uncharacterized membrane protein YvlD (DUF360 family)